MTKKTQPQKPAVERDEGTTVGVRSAFPEVCKWFQRDDRESASEIVARAQRLLKQGTSPCQDCPLCPGDH